METTKEEKMEEEMKFPAFPYEPYSIQLDFMKALYQSLNNGGVAMLESPTGTGKTLSIICSALQWIVDRNRRLESESQSAPERVGDDSDEPDWMRSFEVEKKPPNTRPNIRGSDNKGSESSCRDLFPKSKEEGAASRNKNGKTTELNEEEEFLVEEYASGDEEMSRGKSKRKAQCDGFTSSSDDPDATEFDKQEQSEEFKVYFCSRTHSQLSQFVKELKKTVFASQLKVVCLGSRKIFCTNEDVLKLGNSSQINERCLELQRKKKTNISKTKSLGGRISRIKASSGCPMLKKNKLQKQFRNELSDHGALDIEDLVNLGKRIGTCPYYGSRSAVPTANLVVLPYQSLLFKSTRQSLGINLKNSVIVIDEAHNLADSLTSMYDSKVTFLQLKEVQSHLEHYLERFRNFLGAGNRRYIQTMIVLVQAFLRALLEEKGVSALNPCQNTERNSHLKCAMASSMAINDFLFCLNIDNINLVKLQHYIKESSIIHKVSGYGAKILSTQQDSMLDHGGNPWGSTLSGFQAFVGFLHSLTNNDGDGRIIISKRISGCSGEQGYLKYVMLAGEKIFSEIVNQAHAVVLAGGTLQPIEETRERLFPWLNIDQLFFFSCGHIVPPQSILPIAVSHGPSGKPFDFSYTSRSSLMMMEELGRLLCNLVAVVPEGIVVFFPSFEYEGQVYDAWKSSGILERISKKKCVFREPRNNVDVELILRKYKETILSLSGADSSESQVHQGGAILLAVVGGKISEGINFSDGMGRCVLLVGLPYASPSDIELMERIKHIEGLGDSNTIITNTDNNELYNGDAFQAGFDILKSCKRRGREYYENLCMKAVNQSIGRVIRHLNDYAAILLVDSRYAYDPVKRNFSHPTNRLPDWIRARLFSSTKNYGEVHRLLHQFFKVNRERFLAEL